MITIKKAPFEEIVQGFDFSDRLIEGDKIADSEWEIASGLDGANAVFDAISTEIEISGGTAVNQYLVTNRVTTESGLKYQRSFKILVAER